MNEAPLYQGGIEARLLGRDYVVPIDAQEVELSMAEAINNLGTCLLILLVGLFVAKLYQMSGGDWF